MNSVDYLKVAIIAVPFGTSFILGGFYKSIPERILLFFVAIGIILLLIVAQAKVASNYRVDVKTSPVPSTEVPSEQNPSIGTSVRKFIGRPIPKLVKQVPQMFNPDGTIFFMYHLKSSMTAPLPFEAMIFECESAQNKSKISVNVTGFLNDRKLNFEVITHDSDFYKRSVDISDWSPRVDGKGYGVFIMWEAKAKQITIEIRTPNGKDQKLSWNTEREPFVSSSGLMKVF